MREVELSQEDSFRLNILLASVDAIRIDDSAMVVYGLGAKGEAKIELHPTCRDVPYLRQVRAVVRRKVYGDEVGAAGALQTVLRLGYLDKTLLPNLLKLGEPEAVQKVATYPEMNESLARLIWWAMPDAGVARSLMRQAEIARGPLGRELVDFLLDYLPFETESATKLDTIRLLLYSGHLDEGMESKIWLRGAHQPELRVPFLEICPERVPVGHAVPILSSEVNDILGLLVQQGNHQAGVLLEATSPRGRVIAATCERILQEPASQLLFAHTCQALGGYYTGLLEGDQNMSGESDQIAAIGAPGLLELLNAIRLLAQTSDAILNPILSRSTATGAFLRDKLQPVLMPVMEALRCIQGLKS